MSKFSVGDHVRVTSPYSAWFDQVGTVEQIFPAETFPCGVTLPCGQVCFGEHELVLADPERVEAGEYMDALHEQAQRLAADYEDAREANEAVDHPAHYGGDTTYETIKVIHAWGLGFNLGNVAKYVSRAGKKGSGVEDLRKARFYIDDEIKRQEAL